MWIPPTPAFTSSNFERSGNPTPWTPLIFGVGSGSGTPIGGGGSGNPLPPLHSHSHLSLFYPFTFFNLI